MNKLKAVVLGAAGVMATIGATVAPLPAHAATPTVSSNTGSANIRASASTSSAIIGSLGNGTGLTVMCWWDGATATGNYTSARWFKIYFGSGNGLIHSSLVANQPTVRKCNSAWANDGTEGGTHG